MVKKKDGISGGLSEKQKARLRRKLPAYLRSAHSWLCFKFQTPPNRDRAKKVPYDPETGQRASYKDPATWGTLEEAIAGCARFHADGVGYAFMYWDNIVGLDLDNCRNPATGKIDQWAREIIREANSYSEVTPSGTGIRIFIDGRWRHPEHRTEGLGSAGKGSVEIYSEWFFAITGDHLPGTPRKIERRSDVISQLHTRFFPPSRPSGSSTIRTAAAVTNDDAALIEKARNAENGEKFQQLWEGKWESYPSESEADIALCGQLAFWTDCDAERMDNLFRQSGRFRPKWDEKHFADGETYGEHTIRVAIENSTATYGGDSGKASPPNHSGASVCIADVQSHPVKWLWRGWIPKR